MSARGTGVVLGARVCYKKQLTPIQLCDYSLFLVWLIINIFKWLYDFLCVILPFVVQPKIRIPSSSLLLFIVLPY